MKKITSLKFKKIPIISWICYVMAVLDGILGFLNIRTSVALFNKCMYEYNLSMGFHFGNDQFDVTPADILSMFQSVLIWIIIGNVMQYLYIISNKDCSER